MKFEPRNRHILLNEIENSKEDDRPTILLPEEYKIKTNLHGLYKIHQLAKDCTKVTDSDLGKLAIVDNSMIETINIDEGQFLLILENHIFGILKEEEN